MPNNDDVDRALEGFLQPVLITLLLMGQEQSKVVAATVVVGRWGASLLLQGENHVIYSDPWRRRSFTLNTTTPPPRPVLLQLMDDL